MARVARELGAESIVSDHFAFGGVNTALGFRRWDESWPRPLQHTPL